MINRGYFSKKKVKERYSVFIRTLRKLSIYKYKHRSIFIKKTHHFNAVIYNVMFPDKVKRMKRRKKEIRK